MTVCHLCGIPADAGFFDESAIVTAPAPGEETVLARYELHRNYCGLLVYFAQYFSPYPRDPAAVITTPFRWEIRVNGSPRDPYPAFERIINPWGLHGFPINVRLDEGAIVEFAVRNTGGAATGVASTRPRPPGVRPPRPRPSHALHVGGRLLGRYWYNTAYGGAPNRL